MIPVTQTKVVIKNSKGEEVVNGNCYAATIASIIEVPITEVPNVEVLFNIRSDVFDWFSVMQTFLTSKGWNLNVDNRYNCFHPETKNHENYLSLYDQLKDKYYIAIGESPRGISHACVYLNGELVHDPHPSREGLISITQLQSIEKQ